MKSTTNKSILLAQVQVAIAMLDYEFNYLEVSERWLQDFGLKGNDIIGLNHLSVFPEKAGYWKKIFSRCLAGETIKQSEEQLQRIDGSSAWFRWDVRPWHDEEGYIGGLVFCSEDITEQKLAQSELKRTLEFLEATNQVARIGVWEVNLETNEAIWSSVTKEIHEVPEDFVATVEGAISFYKEGKSRNTIAHAVATAISKGISFDEELLIITAGGNERWVRAKGGAAFKDGKCIRIYGTFQDINEKKLQSIQLEESEKKYRSIVANSIHAFLITTPDGKILDVNNAGQLMFGYSLDEFSKITRDNIIVPTNHFSDLLELRQRTGKTKGEVTCVRKDGTTFPCEFSSVIFRDANGEERSSTIIIDLSEQKKAEQEYLLLLNNTEECFVLISRDYKIITFNEQFNQAYRKHLKRDVQKGDYAFDYIQPERVAIVKEVYQRVLMGEEVITELPIVTETGTVIISNHFKPVYDNNKELYGIFITSKDITQEKQAKEKILENERRFKSLVENSGDAIAVLTKEAGVIYISPSVEKILGYTEQDMYSTDLVSLIHPDDVAGKALKMSEVLANPGVPVKDVTGRMRHKDGSWRWIEATMTNMLHDPNINGIVDNFKDITQKKQLEQEREFEKLDKEALISSTKDLIWSVDNEYKLLAANNAFLTNMETMAGYSIQPGDNLLDIKNVTKGFKSFWKELYDKALDGNSFSSEFYTPEIGDNPSNWSEVSLNPIFNGDNIVGIACFGKIITESKRMESLHILEKEVLEFYTMRKSSLYDTITYLIKGVEQIHPELKCSVLKLTEGKLFNSSSPSLPIEYIKAIDGFDAGEGMGSCGTSATIKDKVIVADISTDPLWQNHKELPLKYNLLACWSYPIIDANQNVLGTFAAYISKARIPRKDEEDTLERARAILTNIIENQIAQEAIMLSEQRLKESEAALKILNTELEKRVSERTSELVNANRQLESFSYSVSHDLRSPLRSIHGFSQLLNKRLSSTISTENMELLALIQSNTMRMEHLIEDMLEFSRISKLNTNKRLIDVNELVDTVWQNLNAREGVNVSLAINSLPSVVADRAMLTQVFVNLLSNAVKYSSKKELAEIEIGATVSEQGTTYYVKDNGAGFDMKHYGKLFAAFQRLHSPIDFEGTGVGLAIVKSIIEKHDGRIWAESKENQGTTFFFQLPHTTE